MQLGLIYDVFTRPVCRPLSFSHTRYPDRSPDEVRAAVRITEEIYAAGVYGSLLSFFVGKKKNFRKYMFVNEISCLNIN